LLIGRDEELRLLEESYESEEPQLIVVYGRRRVGKTALVARLLEGRRAVYLIARYSEPGLALADFAEQLEAQGVVRRAPRFRGFGELYRLIADLGLRLVVVDEFQRLLRSFDAVEALRENWVLLERAGVMLVVVCSPPLIGEIPLRSFGKLARIATGKLLLRQLPYRHARLFAEGYPEEERVRAYGVLGGVPGYISLLDPKKGLRDNVWRLVFSRKAPLREEPLAVLSYSLREPARYMRILEAIARGAHTIGKISLYAGVRRGELMKYMNVLTRGIGLVERRYPLLEEGRRGRARYYLADNFFRFWFGEVYPRWHLLELERREEAFAEAWRRVEDYAAQAFKDIAREHFGLMARRGRVEAYSIGAWWGRGVEVDLAALGPGTVYVGEAVWTREPLGEEALRALAEKAEHLPFRGRRAYVLYSRAGFAFEAGEGVLLFSLEDVARGLAGEGHVKTGA